MYQFILWVFLLVPITIQAQTVKLSGRVQAGADQPVPYTTVHIQNSTDTTIRQSTLTDSAGMFTFESLKKGHYVLKIKAVGFKPVLQQVTLINDRILENITLNKDLTQLSEVAISAKKPTVTHKIDRAEFNVENTVLSSTNAWEIVKRSPGVQSGGGELSIRGSKDILVTINDKKVYLRGEELKAFLEGTNGGDIRSVEVITNPPAKYEASGSAVINIKMKKNIKEGYKGSVSTSYQQGIYAKENISTSQYYKTGKLSLFGSYSLGTGIYYNEIREVTQYLAQQQTWVDVLHRKNNRDAEHNYRAGIDYDMDSLNKVSLGVDGYIARKNHALYNVPTDIYNSDGTYQSFFASRNYRLTPNTNTNGNLAWEHTFSLKEKLSVITDYTNYRNNTSQDVNTSGYGGDQQFARFWTDNAQHIRLFSAQADYSRENKLFNLEAGVKYSRVEADNNLDFETDSMNGLVNDPELSNLFNYRETVKAGYIGLDKDISNWSFKAGIRGEYTRIDGNSLHPQQISSQDYFKLFPTLFVQDKIDANNQLGFSYGKRITRPPYNYLNPSKSYFTPNSYLVGDANLKPALTDQLNLLYTFMGKYNATLYYMADKNPTIQLPVQDNTSNTLIQKVTNIPKNNSYGIDLSTSIQPAAWWSIDLNPGAAYVESNFILPSGDLYRNHAWTVNGAMDNQFMVNKTHGLTAGINFNFNTNGVQGPAKVSGMSSLGFSARKKLFSDQAELSLIVSDVYRGERMKVSSDYADQHNYFTYYGDTQNFRISFKYNLGNVKLKGSGLKGKTDEQNRL
ncbi:MAG TPA: outer membrane beta-barrel family protein [Pedobacter sp.]